MAANAKTLTRSFAGGEISALLRGRLDLAKNQTGLAKCENFEVTPQGPVENRAGFEFIGMSPSSTAGPPPALIPFVYNAQQAFALEFGNGYIRFYTNGAILLETGKAITGITQAASGVFAITGHGFTAGQWVQFAGIGGMTALNGRRGVVATVPDANHVTLTDPYTGATFNTTGLPAYTAGGTASRIYQIASPYAGTDVFDLHYVQSADVLTITHEAYNPRELRRLGATNWTLSLASFVPTINSPAAPGIAGFGPGGGTPIVHEYATTAIAAGTSEESGRSTANNAAWDLSVAGNYLQISTTLVTGASRYNIYKSRGGIFGYIGQSDGSPFNDINIEPDMSKTPPVADTPFATENPRAVSYFEQRRWFGGGGLNPQTLWATRSGTESSMNYSIPTLDSDRIVARIVAREAHTIRHLVPLSDLLALTSGGVWKITASDAGPITPASISVKPQSYVGASNVQPVVTSDSVVYAQDRGSHIREVAYKFDQQSYVAGDVSVLAPHLFDFRFITQLSASVAPTQIVWAVRDDGMLLGMTYQPEHEVKAWHRHTTDGTFCSICAIPEGSEDGVYAVVQREVGGSDYYLIERKHSRQFLEIADCFFVDSGLSYIGAPATTISGLWHLEGVSAAILADGGTHPRRTVVNGQITLEAPASKVHIGRAYNADAQLLPPALEAWPAFGQGMPKNANAAWLSVYQSSSIKVGPNFDKLRELPQRSISDDYGSPPALLTGLPKITLDPSWEEEGGVCIRQSEPLPLTIRAVITEVATGG